MPQQTWNVVVQNPFFQEHLHLLNDLFLEEDGTMDDVLFISEEWDMYDLLKHIGAFPSKGQARKNWKHSEGPDIPKGFSIFTFGKLKHELYVLNAVPHIHCYECEGEDCEECDIEEPCDDCERFECVGCENLKE